MRPRRRRNNTQTRSAPEDKVDAIPEELLGLVFLRLTSPLDLVRAALTCRRWHHVIAADGFRVLASLHGAPPSHVAGHYLVDKRRLDSSRPPGLNPRFVPSSSSPWAGIVAARNLALDFLPRMTEYGDVVKWELADVRGSLLLLLHFESINNWSPLSDIVVCDPLARRYKRVPLSAWFRCCYCFSGLLLDDEDARASISVSNFRLTCAFYRDGVAKAYLFSSTAGGRWTSGATTPSSRVIFSKDYWTAAEAVRFEGSAAGSAYWTVGGHVLAVDKGTGELSLSVLPDALRGKRRALEYVYELPWPPTIRASLSKAPC